VTLVLHVDPPADPKDYLHRSGRTARAGADGVVVLLATPTEERDVQKMLAAAGVRPQQRDVHANDEAAAEITGARKPSGTPIVVVSQAQSEHRAKRGVKTGARPGSSGANSARPGGAAGASSRFKQGRPPRREASRPR
jgi:superfamily II DNA/RNA helicase